MVSTSFGYHLIKLTGRRTDRPPPRTLAREHSTAAKSKAATGCRGMFGLRAACKRLSPGSLSDVVSTSFGYHLIKLTGRKD